MLYLKLFVEILIKNPIRAIGFFLSGLSLCLLLGQSDKIQQNVMSSLPKMGEAPHFFALVDQAINSESIRRKLMDLPGVKSVRNIPGAKLKTQLSEVLGDVGVELPDGMGVPSVAGLKISFAPQLEIRSQKLIKKYLARLTGDEKVTVGPTIGGEKKADKWMSSFKDSLKLKIGTVIVALAALLYLVFGIALGGELGKEAYLVERFSRRRNVVQVSAGLGFLCFGFLMMVPSLVFGNVNIVGLGIFSSITLVFYIITTKRGWRAA